MKIQGKLEGVIKESRIEGLAGVLKMDVNCGRCKCTEVVSKSCIGGT